MNCHRGPGNQTNCTPGASYAYRQWDYAREPAARPHERERTTRDDDLTHAATRHGGTRPGAAATTARAAGRLRNGELRRQVAGFLADRAGREFTPGEVARGLPGGPRSSGAVGNALAVLADRGEADQASTKPVRYRATATTTAAASVPPAASRSPRRARTPGTAAPPATTATPAPSVLSGSAAAAVVSGPVTRPNGQLYHPRQLSGLPDVTALRKLREAGVASLLYGPPGTGKTSVVEAAFPDLVTVSGDGDTTVADLVGEYTQTPDGRYVFVHGPLVTAMREGRTLFIDDATLIPPTVLAVVYPAMDGRRQIIVKANGGEVVTADAGVLRGGRTQPRRARRGAHRCAVVAGFPRRSRCPPITTSPPSSRSTAARCGWPATSPPACRRARSGGHRSCGS